MRNPERLEVRERATELAVLTYAATATLPLSEQQNLVDQMRRAAVSVGSNISEGCGRSTDPSFLSYLQIAMGSATELEYQAGLAATLGMGDVRALRKVVSMSRRVKTMLTRLTQAVRRRNNPRSGS